MATPANEHVLSLFDLAKSAVEARQSMDEAVRTGVTTQYHRMTRDYPEYRFVKPLLAARKQLSALAKERRDAETANDPWKVQELSERIAVVAEGAMMWFGEQLGWDQAVDEGDSAGGEGSEGSEATMSMDQAPMNDMTVGNMAAVGDVG